MAYTPSFTMLTIPFTWFDNMNAADPEANSQREDPNQPSGDIPGVSMDNMSLPSHGVLYHLDPQWHASASDFPFQLRGRSSAAGEVSPDLPLEMPKFTSKSTNDIPTDSVDDYEQKFPEDPMFEETAENARVWQTYLEESAIFDENMIG
ncbi:hypothetical protein J3R30DRAFT_3399534 [Lentinula aciculospora]|uniref:Uncharacterized protein n=1 Tax=Lentinula aciculospora TaxID=153920 RepID=A0A9W9DWU3_9AGAR|nr:hypothetical protein J3R30DRAFT_3399534 [Lentinula aciculospora]